MAESLLSKVNKRPLLKRLIGGGAMITTILSVAACGDQTKAREHFTKELGIAGRIAFDYAGGRDNGENIEGQNCLDSTAYDPYSSGSPAVISTLENTKGQTVAEVTPNQVKYPGSAVLKLVGFSDFDHYLQPANSQSANILKIYGCDPSAPLLK